MCPRFDVVSTLSLNTLQLGVFSRGDFGTNANSANNNRYVEIA